MSVKKFQSISGNYTWINTKHIIRIEVIKTPPRPYYLLHLTHGSPVGVKGTEELLETLGEEVES